MEKNRQDPDSLYIGKEATYYFMAETDFVEAEFDYDNIERLKGTGEIPPGFIRTCAVKYADAAEKYLKSLIADFIQDGKFDKYIEGDRNVIKRNGKAEVETAASNLSSHKIWRELQYVQRHFPEFPFPDLEIHGNINKAHQSFGYPLDGYALKKGLSFKIDIDSIREFRHYTKECKKIVDYIRKNYIKDIDGNIYAKKNVDPIKEENFVEETAPTR